MTKLILYLTATYPSTKEFISIVKVTKDSVDIYEIGIPTNNPKYDGHVIRETYRQAEVIGLNSLHVLRKIHLLKNFIVMAYFEDYENILEDLINYASTLKVKSVLLPDLLFDYFDYIDNYVVLCRNYGIEPSFFISSKFPYKIIEKLCKYNPYFIYLGLHASSGVKLPIHFERNVKVVRRILGDDYNLFVGFAINSISDVLVLKKIQVDGIIIGSAFIKILKEKGYIEGLNFLKTIKRYLTNEYPK